MHLYVLLLCVLWGSEIHLALMKAVTVTSGKNLTALCDEIQEELDNEKKTYKGPFRRPQNTSKELCYAEFTEIFTCVLKNLTAHNQVDQHIKNVYQNMKELPKICPKLEPADSSENCTTEFRNCATEESNFSMFKDALKRVITAIEGWKSCQKIEGSLWDSVLSQV